MLGPAGLPACLHACLPALSTEMPPCPPACTCLQELYGRYNMGDGLTAELAYEPKGNRTSLALFTTM